MILRWEEEISGWDWDEEEACCLIFWRSWAWGRGNRNKRGNGGKF